MSTTTISNEKMIILDLIDDGPSIKLLGQLHNKEENFCNKEKVMHICRASQPLIRLPITQINVGTVAIAQINSISSIFFYRVQIIDNRNWNTGCLNVLLIDECLWNQEIPLSSLFGAPQSVLEIPRCSEVFYLADVSPLCDNNWSDSCISFLKIQLLNKLVSGTVCRENGKISLFRPYEPGEQGQLLAKTMIQCGMAHITPSFPGLTPLPSPNHSFIPDEYTKNSFLYAPDQYASVVSPQSCSYPLVPVASYLRAQKNEVSPPCSSTRSSVTLKNPDIVLSSYTDEEHLRFKGSSVTPGFNDKCQISYIEKGPLKFAVKLFSNQHLEKNLKERLEYICLSSLKSLSNVEYGKCVLCKFDQKLCRGIIVGIENYLHGSLSIYLVDLGSEEVIPVNCVWRLPKELFAIPILVLRCRLNNLPKSCNSQLIKNFRNLVEKQVLNITFGKETSDLLFTVDLFLENYPVVKLISLSIYPREKLVTGDEVVLSYASQNLGLLYLHLSKNLTKIAELQRNIMKESLKANIVQKPYNGYPCIAFYNEDSNYYRGLVIDSTYGAVIVYYVDFGNEEHHTKPENIKELPSTLLNQLPSQAVACILDEVEDLMFSTDDIYNLENKIFIATVVEEVQKSVNGIATPILKVRLVDKVTKRCLNDDILQKCALRKDRNSKRQIVHFADKVLVYASELNDGHELEEKFIEKKCKVNKILVFPDLLKACRVTFVVSPLLFFVTFAQNEETIKNINRILRNNFSLASNYHCSFAIGDEVMIASSKEKDSYYRAIIVSCIQNDLFNLRLVDVGKEIAVAKSQVKSLCPDISLDRYPEQAIKCALEDPSLVLEMQGRGFEAAITKEPVKIHFIRKEGDTWMVSLVKTIDLLADPLAAKPSDSRILSHHRLSTEDKNELSRSDQCRNWRERSVNGESLKNGSLQNSNKPPSLGDKTSKYISDNRGDEGTWKPKWKCQKIEESSESASWKKNRLKSNDEDVVDNCKISSSSLGNNVKSTVTEYVSREPNRKIKEQPVLLSTEVVFVVSYDEISKEVWVQRKCDTDMLDEITASIETFVNSDKGNLDPNLLKSLSKGSYCLAQSFADDDWYRAQILSMDDSMVKVHYIDYGNEEEINMSKIHILPDSLWVYHSLAYLCYPQNSDFSRIVNSTDEEMVVQVLSNMNGKYIINLYSGCVTIKGDDSNNVFTEEDVYTSDGKPQIRYIIPPLGVEVSAFISHVDDNGSLHLQVSENSDLIDNMANVLESASHTDLEKIEEGSFCCAKYLNREFYRANIISVDSESQTCLVKFLDYGDYGTIAFNDLKELPLDCWTLPGQDIHCVLYSERRQCILEGEEVKNSLKFFVDKEISGYFEKGESGVLILRKGVFNGNSLEDLVTVAPNVETSKGEPSVPNVEQINDVQETFDAMVHEYESVNEKTSYPNREIEVSISDKSDDLKVKSKDSTQHSIAKGTISSRVNDEACQKSGDFIQDDMGYITPIEEDSEVSRKSVDKSLLITFVENEGENFWIQDLGEASQLDILMTEIDEYVRNEGKAFLDPQINDLCICKYSQDEGYYRAKILNTENGMIFVHYIDYGNSDHVSLTDIYTIPEKFQKLSPQAFLCKITSLIDCDRTGMSIIADYAASAETLTGQVEENEDGKVLVNVFINGEPLENVKNNLLSKNVEKSRIVNEEVYVTINEEKEFNEVINHDYEKETEDYILGNVNEFTNKIIDDPTVDNVAEVTVYKVNDENSWKSENYAKENVVDVTPMEEDEVSSRSLEKSLLITFVENEGENIWVQDLGEASQLDSLMTEIDEYVRTEGESLLDPQINDLCICKFSQDEGYYRAKILNVDNDVLLVHYIDYGNYDNVSTGDIYKIPEKYQKLCPQAFLCKIAPITDCDKSDMSLITSYAASAETLTGKVEENQEGKVLVNVFVNGEPLEIVKNNLLSNNLQKLPNINSVNDANEEIHVTVSEENEFNDEIIYQDKDSEVYSLEKSSEYLDKVIDPTPATVSKRLIIENEYNETSLKDQDFLQGNETDITSLGNESKVSLETLDKSLLITYVENEGENIWVQDLGEASQLDTLMTEIDEYVKTEGEALSDPQINDLCICKFSKDEGYYRAKILNIQNDVALVHFIDYGNSDHTSTADMYRIPEKYQEMSPQAFLCKIGSLVDCDKAGASLITDYAASADILTGQVEDKEEGKILVKVCVNGEPLERVKDRLLGNCNMQNIINKIPQCDDDEITRQNENFISDEISFPEVDIAINGREIDVNIPRADQNMVEQFAQSMALKILNQVLFSFIIEKHKDCVEFEIPTVQEQLLGIFNIPCAGKDVSFEETQSLVPEKEVIEDSDVHEKKDELMDITCKNIDGEIEEPSCREGLIMINIEEENSEKEVLNRELSSFNSIELSQKDEETSEYSFNSCNEYDSEMQYLLDDYDFSEEVCSESNFYSDKAEVQLVNEVNKNIPKSFDYTEDNSSEMKVQNICKEPLVKERKDSNISENVDDDVAAFLQDLKEVSKMEEQDIIRENTNRDVFNEKRNHNILLSRSEDMNICSMKVENEEPQISIEEPILFGDEQSAQVNQENTSTGNDFTGFDAVTIPLEQTLVDREDFDNGNSKINNNNNECVFENSLSSQDSIFTSPLNNTEDKTENANFEGFTLEVLDNDLFSCESITSNSACLYDISPSIKDDLEYAVPDPFEYQEAEHTCEIPMEKEKLMIELSNKSKTANGDSKLNEYFEDVKNNKLISCVDDVSEKSSDSKAASDVEFSTLETSDNTGNKVLDITNFHQVINKYDTSEFDELISSSTSIHENIAEVSCNRTEQYTSNSKDAKSDSVPTLSNICLSVLMEREENEVFKSGHEEIDFDLERELTKLHLGKVCRAYEEHDNSFTEALEIDINYYQTKYEELVANSRFLADSEVCEDETISVTGEEHDFINDGSTEEDRGVKAAADNLCDEEDEFGKLGVAETVADNFNIDKESCNFKSPEERSKEIDIINSKETDVNLYEPDDFTINAGLGEKSHSYEICCQVNESESILANLSTYNGGRNSVAIIGNEIVRYSVNQKSPCKETRESFIGGISSTCGSKILIYSDSGENISSEEEEVENNSSVIVDNNVTVSQITDPISDIDSPEIKENVNYGKITNITSHGTWVSFWIQSMESLPTFQTIEKEMRATIRKGLTFPNKIEIGQIYASYFCGDLLRTKVLSVRKENLKVFFIDIGKTCNITAENLYDCPSSICGIPAMSKSYNLAVLIPAEKIGKVTILLQERCSNQTCSYIDVTMFLRNHLIKSHFSFAFVATENVGGSVTDFLVEKGVAQNFTHLDVSYLGLMKELNKISLNKIKEL